MRAFKVVYFSNLFWRKIKYNENKINIKIKIFELSINKPNDKNTKNRSISDLTILKVIM